MSIDDIRELVNKKEKEQLSGDDEKKMSMLKVLLKDDEIFFKIDSETACGILSFLGIKDDEEVIKAYFSLISYERYKENQGYIIDNKEEER